MKNKVLFSLLLSCTFNFSHAQFASAKDVITGFPPPSSAADRLAIADIDGDGINDIVTFWLQSSLSWIKGLGGGIYDQSPKSIVSFSSLLVPGTSVILSKDSKLYAADFDNDGKIDIVTDVNPEYTDHDAVYVIKNLGGGTFGSPVLVQSEVRLSNIGDVNKDGKMDIIVEGLININGDNMAWLENKGGFGSFTKRVIGFSNGVNYSHSFLADLDGDNDNDIVVNSVYYFLNDGSYNFGNVKTFPPLPNVTFPGGFADDVDNDGDMDVITIMNDGIDVNIFLHTNDGQANFTSKVIDSVPGGGRFENIAKGDFNTDGNMDFSVNCWKDCGIEVMINNGDGTFSKTIVQTGGGGVDFDNLINADFDSDGKTDIGISNQGNRKIQFFGNQMKQIGVGIANSSLSPTDLILFPNPSYNGKFKISNVEKNSMLEVFDLLGNKIKQDLIIGDETTIDLTGFENGTYLIQVQSKSNNQIIKAVLLQQQ